MAGKIMGDRKVRQRDGKIVYVKSTGVYIPEKMRQFINEKCSELEKSLSDYIRDLIRKEMEKSHGK